MPHLLTGEAATPGLAPKAARPGKVDREIARLGMPAFGALVAEPLYLLGDTAVVGHRWQGLVYINCEPA
jgi:Na+-driven multidrug efflux pump